jgi:hypothetical protein
MTILRRISERQDKVVWIGLLWLKRGTSGRALVNTVLTFGFHNIFRYSSVAVQLAASQEGLISMELVI